MRHQAIVSSVLLAAAGLSSVLLAQESAGEHEVTIKGGLQCNGMCVPDPKPQDHVFVIYAVDGSPEIAATVKKVMDQYYPEGGLNADAAQKLEQQFDAQLKYYLAPESTARPPGGPDNPADPKHYCHCGHPYSITGVVYEKDGKKWIKASKMESIGFNALKYPAKMLLPDKPFVMPDKNPLVLKLNDSMTVNCIKIPAGKVYMGEQVYVATRYLEQFPRLCTLTRPFYISEIPITQELWEAVMGSNPSKTKDPKLPVENPASADVEKFCETLSAKTGHKVRLPTGAEWEYVARVGASNPGFPEKYHDQGFQKDDGKKAPGPVRSQKPNAWGIYDLFSPWWEMSSDAEKYPSHHDEVDPKYPAASGGKRMLMGLMGETWTLSMREFERYSGYTSKKFRIVVDAE